jgi:excinuclease UvrABC nuclease subunit
LPFANNAFAFDKQNIERVYEKPGVYGLFYWNPLTRLFHCLYVGQSDNLRRRLAEHYKATMRSWMFRLTENAWSLPPCDPT